MENKNKGLAIALLMVPVLLLLAAGVATYLSVLEKRVPVYAPTQEEYQADYISLLKQAQVYVTLERMEERKAEGDAIYVLGEEGGILVDVLAKRLMIYKSMEQRDTIGIEEALALYRDYDEVAAVEFQKFVSRYKAGSFPTYEQGMEMALGFYREAEGEDVLGGKAYEELTVDEWKQLHAYALAHPDMTKVTREDPEAIYSMFLGTNGIIESYVEGRFENRKIKYRLVEKENVEESTNKEE